jgi:hypothetical protein
MREAQVLEGTIDRVIGDREPKSRTAMKRRSPFDRQKRTGLRPRTEQYCAQLRAPSALWDPAPPALSLWWGFGGADNRTYRRSRLPPLALRTEAVRRAPWRKSTGHFPRRGVARGRSVDATRAILPSDQLPIVRRSDRPTPPSWLSECCRHAFVSPDASKYQSLRLRIAVHSRDISRIPAIDDLAAR